MNYNFASEVLEVAVEVEVRGMAWWGVTVSNSD